MEEIYKASISFRTNEEASRFATMYTRKTLRGHTVSQCKVDVYGLSNEDKKWIDNYVSKLNKEEV